MAGTDGDGVVVRHLTQDDVAEAGYVFLTSLGVPPPVEEEAGRYGHYWDVERSLGAYDRGGRLLGVAATFPSRLTVEGGAAVTCAAVPSVGVRPDSHGRGVGRALLERQVTEALDRGAQLLALNASEVGIYGRYGYGPTSRWWAVRADPRQLRWRADAPTVAPGSVEEFSDLDEVERLLPDLHARAFGRWSGELERVENLWWPTLNPRESDDSAKERLWAVHRDPGGTVDAAVCFRVELAFDDTGFANRVEVLDSIALDAGVEARLWRWLLERNLAGRVEAERTNPRSPLPWMLANPRALVTAYDSDAVWVRVLDLPGVLGARSTAGREPVVVRVVDELVAANDRCWRLSGEDGVLVAEPTDREPEVTVPVDLLSSLAWGFVRAATLAAAGRIDASSPAAVRRLDALVATDGPAWCSTSF